VTLSPFSQRVRAVHPCLHLVGLHNTLYSPYLARTRTFQPVSFRLGGDKLGDRGLVVDCLEYCGGGHRTRVPHESSDVQSIRKRQPSWHTVGGRSSSPQSRRGDSFSPVLPEMHNSLRHENLLNARIYETGLDRT